MAYTLDETAQGVGDGDTAFTISLTGSDVGDVLMVGISWLGTATVSSVAVSGESNMTLRTATNDAGAVGHGATFRNQFSNPLTLTAGGAKTITVTMSASLSSDQVGAFAVLLNGSGGAFDAENSRQATSVSGEMEVSLTTVAASAAVLALYTSVSGDHTPGTGYTSGLSWFFGGFAGGMYDVDVGAAGAKTVGATQGGGGGNAYFISAVSIAESGGGGGVTIVNRESMRRGIGRGVLRGV
jgi:hypothetical protein